MIRGEMAGRLDQRISIERRGEVRDGLAGPEGAWSIIAMRWAAVEPDGTGDPQVGEAASACARFRMTVRPVAVELDDRLLWAGRTLRVRAIVVDPAFPDRMVLRAEEVR